MPTIRKPPESESRVLFIPVKIILSAVHTFHNCHMNKCKATKMRVIRQERQDSGQLADEILHDCNSLDRVMNLAQMRSADLLHPFHWSSRYPGKPQSEVLTLALSREDSNETSGDTSGITLPDSQVTMTSVGTQKRRRNAAAGAGPRKRKRIAETPVIGGSTGTLRPADWSMSRISYPENG
ncbi:hypothetical protein QCA50_012625 [Cerrena zonata]|uniref:Uncharacterized protein n=1 Tax=Cerrena zonata TaxID=2478898 RepID=A0AAW0G3S2_9APHY